MNILITLNKEVYEQTIGKLPNCYLVSCVVDKVSNSDKITKKDKEYAIEQYWIRSKIRSSYTKEDKLFKFSLI